MFIFSKTVKNSRLGDDPSKKYYEDYTIFSNEYEYILI